MFAHLPGICNFKSVIFEVMIAILNFFLNGNVKFSIL